jgi:hypothetical protein
MLAQGTPLHVVSEVLGHASIAITKDVYGHLLKGDKRKAAESMSLALFGRRRGAVAPAVQHSSHVGRDHLIHRHIRPHRLPAHSTPDLPK